METRYIWFDDVNQLSCLLCLYFLNIGSKEDRFIPFGMLLDVRVVRSPLLKDLYL